MNEQEHNHETSGNEKEHDHGHGHDHGHSHDDPFHPQLGAPLDTSEMDPANRSLAEALRMSFFILFLLMVGLVIVFILSGMFRVEENSIGVVLQFGKLKEEPKPPGGPYFAMPKPIDEVLIIPTRNERVELRESFMFFRRAEDMDKPLDQLPAKSQLNPGVDGSLITGDRNIVHGEWTIDFRIDVDHVINFVRNVSADTNKDEMMKKARERVRHAAERAIVHAVATVTSDEFIRRGGSDVGLNSQIKKLTQEKLDELKSGITITSVATSNPIPPQSVRREFDAVTQASNRRATLEENARKDAQETLYDAAGPAHEALALAIDYYEIARRDGDEEAAEKGLKAIDEMLEGNPTGPAVEPLMGDGLIDQDRFSQIDPTARLGGEASKMLNEALSFRRTAQETVRAEANRFSALLDRYPDKESQANYLERRWYGLLEKIMRTDINIAVQPEGSHIYLEVNLDPRWAEYLARKKHIAQQALHSAQQSLMNTRQQN